MTEAKIQDIYVLSPMQEGMLFHYLMDGKSNAYFEQFDLAVEGKVDQVLLEECFRQLVARYDVLRTIVRYDKTKRPVQIVLRQRNIQLYYEDMSPSDFRKQEDRIEEFKEADRDKGFDPGKDLLMRVSLLRLSENQYHLIWSFHHIIMDGWCLGILYGDLLKIYDALRGGRKAGLAPPVPYKHYIAWLEKQDKAEGLAYWKNYLEGYETKAVIPTSGAGTGRDRKAFKNAEHIFTLDSLMTEKMAGLGREHQITINTIFQTVWGIILQRYNNTEDVVFGSVVSGRPSEIEGVEDMVGLFINTTPVRIVTKAATPFLELLKATQNETLKSRAFDYIPLAEIQSATPLKGELIDHILIFENFPFDEAGPAESGNGFNVTGCRVFEQVNYNFSLTVIPGETYSIRLGYNALVYDEHFIETIGGHIRSVLEQVCAKPQMAAGDIDILSAGERDRILYRFNDTIGAYPDSKTVSELFEEQAAKTPDAVALVFRGRKITYRELNAQANRIARLLREKGVKADGLVGLMVERSVEMMAGLLGILKAGGAYLPIDTEFPADRIEYMLRFGEVKILLTQKKWAEKISFDGEIIDIETDVVAQSESSNMLTANKPSDLLYVMFTSGSTGTPKGVMIEHGNMSNFISAMKRVTEFAPGKKILALTTISFDIFALETLLPLVSGMEVCLADADEQKDPEAMIRLIGENGINILQMTPSRLQILLGHEKAKECLKGVEAILVGGEALPQNLLDHLKQVYHQTVFNIYGPTETTVWSTVRDVTRDADISIGRPVLNTQVYIVNRNNRPQPVGVSGELLIGGAGVGRGYFKNEDLTREKFADNPFLPGGRIYRTGDLARWLPDGNIEFQGRIDHQVKIRGFRIELGEIENRLMKHGEIEEAAVLARDDESGSKYLCAYYVAGHDIAAGDLRDHLSQTLPDYMTPSCFVRIEKMPLTPSGKINRKALPAPSGAVRTGVEYEAPGTQLETELARIWQDVLGLEKIGVHDHFFEIGGHSLKAIALIAKMEKAGHRSVRIADIFKHPTIRELARHLTGGDKGRENEKIATADAVGENISGRFGGKAALVQYEVDGHSSYVLYLSRPMDERKKEIKKWIDGNVCAELHPQYMLLREDLSGVAAGAVKTEAHEFSQIAGLEQADAFWVVQKFLSEVKKKEKQFHATLLSGNVVAEYPATPMQQGHVDIPVRLAGSRLMIKACVEPEDIRVLHRNMIRGQALLRSVLFEQEGKLHWREYEAPENVYLPFLDLSRYDAGAQLQIMELMFTRYLNREFTKTGGFNYRVLLVKCHESFYRLYMDIDHMLFDALSGVVIEDYFDLRGEGSERPALAYRDYVRQILLGPQGIDGDQLTEAFQLEEFPQALEKTAANVMQTRKPEVEFFDLEFPVPVASGGVDNGQVVARAFELFCVFCRRLLSLDDLPVGIVYHGRRYQDKNYFHLLGEFVDILPIYVSERKSYDSAWNEVENKIRFAARHNVNFACLAGGAVQDGFQTAASLFAYQDYRLPTFLFFNYLGEALEEAHGDDLTKKEIYAKLSVQRKLDIEDIRTGINFWVTHNKTSVTVSASASCGPALDEMIRTMKEEGDKIFR